MSVKKLLGTAACMVIIGVSAGVSFGLVVQLTAQVSTPAQAQVAVDNQNYSTAEIATEAQAPSAKSDVTPPVLILPQAQIQPEPPLLRYGSASTDDAGRTSPDLPQIVRLDDEIIVDTTSQPAALIPKQNAPAQEVVASVAPLRFAPAGSSKRFRAHNTKDDLTDDRDGIFEQALPVPAVVTPRRVVRPSPARAVRAAQRTDRFRRLWAIGVYR